MPEILRPVDPPPYPTNSFDYLQNVNDVNGVLGSREATVKLNIAIIGAGIGGLSAAIALRRSGHTVTIYESAGQLAEIGAGIQIPPNSGRILRSWGLEPALREKSVQPKSLYWKRWQDGRVIAHTRYQPYFERWFEVRYYVTHRADLHQVLHEKAVELGVQVKLGHSVLRYDLKDAEFRIMTGIDIRADLVVAADGIKSLARSTINGPKEKPLRHHNMAAYRATVPVESMKAVPEIASSVDFDSLNFWVGDRTHVMSYSIVGGDMFNVVANIPEPQEPGDWDPKDGCSVEKMKSYFHGWDPALTGILDMVSKTSKWPVADIEVVNRWSSPSKNLILLGDAAHAMIPFMSIGAAMAVEDAAALAQSLMFMSKRSDLDRAIDIYEEVRQSRVRPMHEASYRHAYTVHLPDGPEQKARDDAMLAEVAGDYFIKSPNQWSDPTTQMWAYQYDAAGAIRSAWAQSNKHNTNGQSSTA